MLRRGSVTLLLFLICSGCTAPPPRPPAPAQARHLVLITIDTLRADRVGAYGYARARTPHIDRLAARGVRFERAYATAPITLPSHASLMTGRYPPGHGARHNGIRVDSAVPTLANILSQSGFTTGAFVSAFPLDRRFGLSAGFAAYSDRMPRGPRGRLENERPGRDTITDALAWLKGRNTAQRMFLWVHLFEPHAPYGQPGSGRPVADRYDDEIAESDSQIGRLLDALGPDASSSVIVVASDHGEAFGEHGEVSHSLFVYDTTLRVPLVIAGPGLAIRTVGSPVSLVDVAPTVLGLLGLRTLDFDGIDLSPTFGGTDLPARDLYAESFAPLLDFGWSPLRALRSEGFKYIDAPRAELYDTSRDPAEERDLSTADVPRSARLRDRIAGYSSASLEPERLPVADREALGRLQALGYASGGGRGAASTRPDPKDRRAIAARISHVISGELQGPALEAALERILDEDPKNPQANLRLGYVLLESNRCAQAVRFLRAAIAARMPGADAHLGLAQCEAAARQPGEAYVTLLDAERLEPDNPVVLVNMGIVLSDMGRHADAITAFRRALALDPDFHEARFNLARAFARAGQRPDAAREAQDLLTRLPANAPQRSEVQRLLDAVR
jgi:choline-sulfatase